MSSYVFISPSKIITTSHHHNYPIITNIPSSQNLITKKNLSPLKSLAWTSKVRLRAAHRVQPLPKPSGFRWWGLRGTVLNTCHFVSRFFPETRHENWVFVAPFPRRDQGNHRIILQSTSYNQVTTTLPWNFCIFNAWKNTFNRWMTFPPNSDSNGVDCV